MLTEQQYISDVLQYVEHGDPQIRGATAILCGALIQAIQLKTRYNTEIWLSQIHCVTGENYSYSSIKWLTQSKACLHILYLSVFSGNSVTVENFVPLLQRSLKDESSVTCKMACAAVRVRIYIYHVARIILPCRSYHFQT